jgi:hypothetical protein
MLDHSVKQLNTHPLVYVVLWKSCGKKKRIREPFSNIGAEY